MKEKKKTYTRLKTEPEEQKTDTDSGEETKEAGKQRGTESENVHLNNSFRGVKCVFAKSFVILKNKLNNSLHQRAFHNYKLLEYQKSTECFLY